MNWRTWPQFLCESELVIYGGKFLNLQKLANISFTTKATKVRNGSSTSFVYLGGLRGENDTFYLFLKLN